MPNADTVIGQWGASEYTANIGTSFPEVAGTSPLCILQIPIFNFPYAVIPFVSAMNAVSRLISSSLKSVSRWPDWTSNVGSSL